MRQSRSRSASSSWADAGVKPLRGPTVPALAATAAGPAPSVPPARLQNVPYPRAQAPRPDRYAAPRSALSCSPTAQATSARTPRDPTLPSPGCHSAHDYPEKPPKCELWKQTPHQVARVRYGEPATADKLSAQPWPTIPSPVPPCTAARCLLPSQREPPPGRCRVRPRTATGRSGCPRPHPGQPAPCQLT